MTSQRGLNGRATRYRHVAETLSLRVRSRHANQRPGALTLGPPIALHTTARSPKQALDFLIAPAPAPVSGDQASTQTDEPWYHTIELPGGVVTPGLYDHRALVPHYGLPDDLTGKRVLDVATFDGFWAFELERRGGQVTALDIDSSLDLDLPPPVLGAAREAGAGVDMGRRFRLAADALGSSVERRLGNVYTLDPAAWGTFDLVHMADLLVHLERPLEALRRVRAVTAGTLHLSEAFEPRLRGTTFRYLGGWNDCEWWVPSLDALAQLVVDAGFDGVEVVRTYQLNSRFSTNGYWRAILRGKIGP
jgi:tRNA (mo5U34)-methyltransferase